MADEKFGEEEQSLLLSFMLSDSHCFQLGQTIIREEYFVKKFRPVVHQMNEYANKHSTIPLPEQIKALTGVEIGTFDPIHLEDHKPWFFGYVERFCRNRALIGIIMDGEELVLNDRHGEIESRVKDAMTISLVQDLGTNYFSDPTERLARLVDTSLLLSTGLVEIDKALGGGMGPGTLNLFAGQSGQGKSLFLQNIALNWALRGLHVPYISLEMSEDNVQKRWDAMLLGMSTAAAQANPTTVAAGIMQRIRSGKMGDLRVKRMSESSTTANDIKAYLREFQIKTGNKANALVIDYLDLMRPISARIDMGNRFEIDKFIAEEVRSLGDYLGIPVLSASQLNRGSHGDDVEVFRQDHIAGGISKINTCDSLFGLRTDAAKKEQGYYEVNIIKARDSDFTGKMFKLGYNKSSMRLTDFNEDARHHSGTPGAVALRREIMTPPEGTKTPDGRDMKALMERFHPNRSQA